MLNETPAKWKINVWGFELVNFQLTKAEPDPASTRYCWIVSLFPLMPSLGIGNVKARPTFSYFLFPYHSDPDGSIYGTVNSSSEEKLSDLNTGESICLNNAKKNVQRKRACRRHHLHLLFFFSDRSLLVFSSQNFITVYQ